MIVYLEKNANSFARSFILPISIFLSVLVFSTSASAAVVTFLLGDHPDAQLFQSDPLSPYGLRLDNEEPAGVGPTFSVGSNLGGLGGPTLLTFDDADLSAGATISGSLERNDDGTFWNATYNLTGLVSDGAGGFTATGGSGSVDEIGGLGRSISLTGETFQNSDIVFIFANDGHRLDGSTGYVGRGWLLPTGSTDDWLVTATQIPLPGAIWMFASCLGLLFGRTLKKSSPA